MDNSSMDRRQNAEAAARMLRDYRERRQEFHAFDSYDEVMDKTRQRLVAKCQKLEEPLKTVASRLCSIADRGLFLQLVCEWKIDYVAETLIHSIEAKNALALANGTRSLVEHLGALTAAVHELERLEESLKGQGGEVIIGRALDRAENFIHRAYYGKSPKVAKSKIEEAHHVNDFLKELRSEWRDIEGIYDFLCEYVHPNYGSNTLVSTGEIAHGRLKPREDVMDDVLVRLHYYCGRCLLQLRDLSIRYSGALIRLVNLAEYCFAPGAKVTNVFAVRAPTPQGDGKSRETAYSFPKARTPGEAIDLCYAYLHKNGYVIQDRRNDGTEGDWMYDVYTTDSGTIWFKVPDHLQFLR